MMRVNFALAEQMFKDRFLGEHQAAPMTRSMKLFIALIFLVPLVAVLWVVCSTVLFDNLSWMDAGHMPWIWLVAMPAGMLIAYYGRRRAGASNHCAKCDYQIAPVGEMPDTCPECGSALDRPDALVVGRQVGSRWPVVLVVAIFVVFVVVPILNIFEFSSISPSRLVPTHRLVDHVIVESDLDYNMLRVLEERRLDDQQIMRLLDEMEMRLQGLGPGEEIPDLWDYHVGNLIEAEAAQRRLGKPVELKLLWLREQYEECDSGISLWVGDAIHRGVYSVAEIEAARSGRTESDDE